MQNYVDLFELGPQVYTYSNGAVMFEPGVYNFPTNELVTPNSSGVYGQGDTLVISQGSQPVSTTPEPSSLVLLGTGVVGAFGVMRRRLGA